MGGPSNEPIFGPPRPGNFPKLAVEKSPFQVVAAIQLEIDKDANRTRLFDKTFVGSEFIYPYSLLAKSPNEGSTDRTQYVQSSCGLVSIMAMTLLSMNCQYCFASVLLHVYDIIDCF